MMVLHIDESDDFRTMLGAFLKHIGHRCDGTGSVDEAVALLPNVDLVIIEVYRKDSLGEALVRTLRRVATEIGRTIPIIAMTVRNEYELVGLEIDGYLKKPADLDAVENVLRLVLGDEFN